jgi:hypothetical protein
MTGLDGLDHREGGLRYEPMAVSEESVVLAEFVPQAPTATSG